MSKKKSASKKKTTIDKDSVRLAELHARDLKRINAAADRLNAEVREVLEYQCDVELMLSRKP